jgi:superfamily II DNA or RNA helicase
VTTSPHPISFIRRQATTSGQGSVLMLGCRELAPRVLPYSRRAGRLLERIGLERPSLKLSGLLAELGAPPSRGGGHRGIPAILVDKLAVALGEMLAGRPGGIEATAGSLPPVLARLYEAVRDLERRTRTEAPAARGAPRIARLTLDETPAAFFYTEGRGLDAVPSGLAVPLAELGRSPLRFHPVRGPMLDAEARLYAIERIYDVILEPIADEGARLMSMLVTGRLVRLALIGGGGLRITAQERALAEALGLTADDEDGGPGRYLVLHPGRARDIVAALALLDDVTVAWASAERIRASRAAPAALRVRLGEARDWLGLSGGLDLEDGGAASLESVLQALREGRRYVVVDKERLVALSDELSLALAPLAAAAPVAPALALLAEAGARVEENDAWRKLQADLAMARSLDGEPPAGLRATLRPYQREGLRFLRRLAAWRTGGVLADDMGLGKTVQAIALLLERAENGPALVVAPTSVCFNWRQELERFAPALRVVRYEGPRRRALLAAGLGAGDVVVASYAVVQRDLAAPPPNAGAPSTRALADVRFHTLVLDEAQQVKNAATRRAKTIRALPADFRVALTGTPLENHTGELWAIFDVVSPGLFGTWNDFKARFASPIEKEGEMRRRRTLARAISPFVLRRKKSEVAPELPARVEIVKHLPLEPAERRSYERTRQALLLDLLREGDDDVELPAGERRVRLLAAITRLRLAACHPMFAGDTRLPAASVEPASKQRALVELLLELKDSGHRALVFSQFVRHLEIARAAADAAGVTSLQLDGSTPAEERQRLVERFQAGEVDAFFLSLKAGGTGLNLVRASYVVHLDPWWNPAVEDQATDRAHRIGQTEPVTVVRLVAEETIEEEILELHAHKRALVEGVLEGTGAAAALSVDELVDILRHTRTSARHEAQELAEPRP